MAEYGNRTATLDCPEAPSLKAPAAANEREVTILGVRVTDTTKCRAIDLIDEMIRHRGERTRSIFFVNAHTLNLGAADGEYRRVLNSADLVFGDGTGVRWAARLQGVRLRDNVNGTDLVPAMFHMLAGFGYRYFLLGADESTICCAADHAANAYPGWTQVGWHHGYLNDSERSASVVRQINEARPDVLLVGMGNPLQERWIGEHREELEVPVCIAVGGLFTYWGGNLRRAPCWLRRWGMEWIGILVQQPMKARRYLLGNPRFVVSVVGEYCAARCRHGGQRWWKRLKFLQSGGQHHGKSH